MEYHHYYSIIIYIIRDSIELDKLIDYLIYNYHATDIYLLGHSTGCQDIIKYLKTGDNTGIIRGCFLQGPVSDRESGMFLEKEKINYYVPIAKELIENNKSDELMPRNAEYIPITAYRYYSLYGVNGDDDYFSSDLSDEKFIELYQHIKVPIIFIESENDQFIPPSVNKLQHIQRMASFIPMNLGKYLLIPNTDHGVTNNYEILINYIVDYIKRRTPLI